MKKLTDEQRAKVNIMIERFLDIIKASHCDNNGPELGLTALTFVYCKINAAIVMALHDRSRKQVVLKEMASNAQVGISMMVDDMVERDRFAYLTKNMEKSEPNSIH